MKSKANVNTWFVNQLIANRPPIMEPIKVE